MKDLSALDRAPEKTAAGAETPEDTAARLGLDVAGVARVRAVTGAKADELAAVDVTADGIVITTTDGVQVIWREAGNPDANGNEGLLLLARPDGDPEGPPYETPIFEAPPKARPKTKAEKADG